MNNDYYCKSLFLFPFCFIKKRNFELELIIKINLLFRNCVHREWCVAKPGDIIMGYPCPPEKPVLAPLATPDIVTLYIQMHATKRTIQSGAKENVGKKLMAKRSVETTVEALSDLKRKQLVEDSTLFTEAEKL